MTEQSSQISRRTKHAMADAKRIKTQTVRLDEDHLAMAIAVQAARPEASFQQLIEKLLEEEVARQTETWEAVAGTFVSDNQELFDQLADR